MKHTHAIAMVWLVVTSVVVGGMVQVTDLAAAGNTPSDAAEATETPTETPTETSPETPAETPTETPAETPLETPAETPTETPTETPEANSTHTATAAPPESEPETPTDSAPRPATVVAATVTPTEVVQGDSVTVAATVENGGSVDVTTALDLTVDGTVVGTAAVDVPAEGNATVAFEPTLEDAGVHEVAVGGVVAGSVTVSANPLRIDGCATITEPGVYQLTSDLTAPTSAPACLVVAASDVVLDGSGHVIDGTGGAATPNRTVHYGVRVAPPGEAPLENVTVRNLRTTGWTHGVHYEDVRGGTVVGVTATGNRVGVVLTGVEGTTVRASTASDNAQHGVRIKGNSRDVAVVGLEVRDNGNRGVFANRADRTTVAESTIDGNAVGVLLQDLRHAAVRDNVLADNAEVGVWLRVTANTTVAGNVVADSPRGILAQAVHGDGDHADHETDDHTDHETDDHTDHETDDHTDHETAASAGDRPTDSGPSAHPTDGTDDHADHGTVTDGDARLLDNDVSGSTDAGIALVGTHGTLVSDGEIRPADGWAIESTDGAADTAVESLGLGDLAVSYTGTDVAVRAVPAPAPDPTGVRSLGAFLEVAGTGADATWTGLAVGYDGAAVAAAGVEESTLHLWRHDGDDWTLLGTPAEEWHWSAVVGTWVAPIEGNAVDVDADAISVETGAFGVYAPLAGHRTTADLAVAAARVSPTAVDDGERVTVSASVENRGSVDRTAVVDLTADGAVVASRSVAVPTNGTADVSYEVALGPGTYDLAVAGSPAGTLTVRGVTPSVSRGGPVVHQTIDVDYPAEDRATVRVRNARNGGVRIGFDFDPRPEATCYLLDHLEVTPAEAREFDLDVSLSRAPADGAGPGDAPAWEGHAGPALGYLTVDHAATFSEAAIDFSVRTACLDERGLEPSDVVLYRYADGTWTALPTRFVDEADGYATIAANAPGLSVFAVGTTRPDVALTHATLVEGAISANETATLEATLENAGRADGSHLLEVTVADAVPAEWAWMVPTVEEVVVGTRDVVVPAGETVTVTVDWSPAAVSEYVVAVDDVAVGTLVVESPASGGIDDATDPAADSHASDAATAAAEVSDDATPAALSPAADPAADEPGDDGLPVAPLPAGLVVAGLALLAGYLLTRE